MAAELGKEFRIIEEGLCGRTTTFEDPTWDHRSGKSYLAPCMESHSPLDLVIIMLGTNDLKVRFSASAPDIARGMSVLIEIVQNSLTGVGGRAPQLLVVAPAPLGDVPAYDAPVWEGGRAKADQLAPLYEQLAKRYRCHFANVRDAIGPEDISPDGIHLTAAAHAKIAGFMAAQVRSLLLTTAR
jgi:lysophospholipase L1-like esterase